MSDPNTTSKPLVGVLGPWLYVQSTGALYRPDGSWCSTCYSGRNGGLNNPVLQAVKDVGPLPAGLYTLGAPVDHPRLGPIAIPLEPDPANKMFDRSAFFVHGDNSAMNHTASEGCIIAPRLARIELSRGGMLKVIAKPAAGEKLA